MTTRHLTQAQIARAVRVADMLGKVAFIMPGGIALVDPALVALPSPPTADPFDLVDMTR